MTTVCKYELSKTIETKLEMPAGAQPLRVDVIGRHMFLWALVDPAMTVTQFRCFEVFGTGREIPDAKRKFINTFFADGGRLVFHAFEKTY